MVVLSSVLFTLTNPFGGFNYLHWDIPALASSSANYEDLTTCGEFDEAGLETSVINVSDEYQGVARYGSSDPRYTGSPCSSSVSSKSFSECSSPVLE